MAVSCGTPTPATTRVVQIDPGPIPTFTQSTPASISAHPSIDQRAGPVGRAYIPGYNFDLALKSSGDLTDRFQYALGVAVRRIDDHEIDPHFDQGRHPIHDVGRHAHSRPNTEPPVFVLAGIGVLAALAYVFEGDEALQVALLVHDGKLFHLVRLQDLDGLIQGRAHRHRHQIVGGHHLPNGRVAIKLKPDVPVRHDPHELVRLVHHRNAPDGVVRHHVAGIGHRVVGRNRDRVENHPVLRPLHAPHLGGLVFDRHAFVKHPGAPLASQRNGHVRLRDRIHGRGQDRNVELDVLGQPGGGIRLAGHHFGMARHEKNIIVGQAFRLDFVVGFGVGGAVRNRLGHR